MTVWTPAFSQQPSKADDNETLYRKWTETLALLDPKVAEAFAGKTNLHDYEAQIDSLAETYEQLRAAFKD